MWICCMASTATISQRAFKSVARALREAVEVDPRKAEDIPSTKGAL